MNAEEKLMRFEELDAGRAMGDLDAVELAEWESLASELELDGDPGLDRLAAELEVALAATPSATLPADLGQRLRQSIPGPAAPAAAPRSDSPAAGGRVVLGPWLGWAVAACLLALLVIPRMTDRDPASADEQRAALLEEADDVRRLPLAGAGDPYAAAKGEVVWSDNRQEGYMTLANLPKNDPSKNQYQLWIVDPDRDEFPVDGGVFNIPAGGDPVVIPIDAKLSVKNPAAFVITLEQPGGVVRSKQEVVVALAKS